jgi:hypothetical protein
MSSCIICDVAPGSDGQKRGGGLVGRMKTKNDGRGHCSSSGCHVAASDVAPGLDGKKGVREE